MRRILALALGHGLASWPLLKVYLAAGEKRVIHASVSLLALSAGQAALLAFAWGVASGDASLTAAATQVSIWLCLLPIYAAVERYDFSLSEAAADLYAGAWTTLRLVILPVVKPGIVAGCIDGNCWMADSTISGRRISMGAGEHGYSAFVDADALTAALGAVVADITEPLASV